MHDYLQELPDVIKRIINYCTLHKVDFERGDEYDGTGNDRSIVTNLDEANVVSSTNKWTHHNTHNAVLLDIDMDAALIKSSTPNHYHLYVLLPRPFSHEHYTEFLRAAAKIGLIQEGYAEASITRGFTSLRLPWVRKELK